MECIVIFDSAIYQLLDKKIGTHIFCNHLYRVYVVEDTFNSILVLYFNFYVLQNLEKILAVNQDSWQRREG